MFHGWVDDVTHILGDADIPNQLTLPVLKIIVCHTARFLSSLHFFFGADMTAIKIKNVKNELYWLYFYAALKRHSVSAPHSSWGVASRRFLIVSLKVLTSGVVLIIFCYDLL